MHRKSSFSMGKTFLNRIFHSVALAALVIGSADTRVVFDAPWSRAADETMAMRSAEHARSAGMLGAIDQPTIRREYKSSTAARYSQPLRVRMYVMSHAQA